MLGDIARGANDLLERCGTEAGDAGRSKKGDFVLTLDPDLARGCDLRVVIEAKDRRMSGREMRDELRAAKTNRDAAAALVVFTRSTRRRALRHSIFEPAMSMRSSTRRTRTRPRWRPPCGWPGCWRCTTLRESEAEVDLGEVQASLTAIREALEAVRSLKVQLSNIGSTSAAVSGGLDKLREAILAWIARAERELAPTR
jgi:hypothetical protein